jgi:hypothetical protein
MSTTPAASPRFLTLSELDHRSMGVRDWLTLLPAILLSVVLNGVFLAILIMASPTAAQANNKLKNANVDDQTSIEDKKDKLDENAPIDMFTPELDAPKDIVASEKLAMPSLDVPEVDSKPSLSTPPPEKDPIGGSGIGDDGKMKGNDALGAEGLKGDPILAELGGVGSGGRLPLGGGAGINTGAGGGSSKSGGFGLRTGDLSSLAKRMGGSDASERAVASALLWLRMHQGPDGRWSLHKYHTYDKRCDCQTAMERESIEKKRGDGMNPDDVAATAMGLLPFLAAGHHHLGQKEESRVVRQALQFLLSRQVIGGENDGKFDSDSFTMYTHGLAAIAVCEAYGMTNDPKLRDAAMRATKFIVSAQNTQQGGWRYVPRTSSDTSVVGWQVMALKSAQMSNLPVPAATLENAARWLDLAQYKEKRGGKTYVKYAYAVNLDDPSAPGGPATTAAGLLNRLYLGWGPRNAEMIQGCDYLMDTSLPPAEWKKGQPANIYTWYYAAQVMHHMGGEYWQKWNPRMRDYLIKSQDREGHKLGSWDPTGDAWGNRGGRLYTTSLSVLTLEVYYRHLPLYRREKLDKENMEDVANKQAEMEKKAVSTTPAKEMKDEPKKDQPKK